METTKELVFLEPNKISSVPFTTSEVIAEVSGIGRKKIKQAIQKYRADLDAFGKVVPYETTLESGQTMTGYRLNEEQATFLMTLLKNTPTVVAFKKELVRQFYAMRDELVERRVKRASLAPVRRSMTDVIRDCIPDSPHKSMWYKHYTDLAYRAALGKSAAQVRREREAPKDAVAADYLTASELEAVERCTDQIGVLLQMRIEYQQIKSMVLGAAAQRAAS